MAKDYSKMNLYQLIIEHENVCRDLDRIKTDSDYIRMKTAEIFKDSKKRDYTKELNTIIDNYL